MMTTQFGIPKKTLIFKQNIFKCVRILHFVSSSLTACLRETGRGKRLPWGQGMLKALLLFRIGFCITSSNNNNIWYLTSMWRLHTTPLRVQHRKMQQNKNIIALSCPMSHQILLASWSQDAAVPHQWFDILMRYWGFLYSQTVWRWYTTHSSIKICRLLLR